MNTESQTTNIGILLLDIGNTNLKWAWLLDDVLGEVNSITHKGQNIEELVSREWSGVVAPGLVYVSSVVGQSLEKCLSDWIERHWSLVPKYIRSTAQACGVTNSYLEPERLGVDRWLAMIAQHCKTPGLTCVVDCGSAVTIDVVGLDGEHLGGLILPGIGLMRQALLDLTSIEFDGVDCSYGFLATDTETAIAAGGVNAIAALVERVVDDVATKNGQTVELVLTGGDADIIQQALSTPSSIEKDLVMQGLITIIKNGND